jgi:hypothetical protein
VVFVDASGAVLLDDTVSVTKPFFPGLSVNVGELRVDGVTKFVPGAVSESVTLRVNVVGLMHLSGSLLVTYTVYVAVPKAPPADTFSDDGVTASVGVAGAQPVRFVTTGLDVPSICALICLLALKYVSFEPVVFPTTALTVMVTCAENVGESVTERGLNVDGQTKLTQSKSYASRSKVSDPQFVVSLFVTVAV